MKKFLVFFVFLFGLACSAMAGYQGEQPDAPGKKGGDGHCVFMSDDTKQHYAVYFRTDEDKVSDVCKSYFDQVKAYLAKMWADGDVAYFVLVASADTQGDSRYNVGLSTRRYNYVANNILPSEARQENKGWITGDASDQKFDPKYGKKWEYRGVYIYPMWARSLCSDDKISTWKANLQMLNDASKKYPNSTDIKKLINNYTQILAICNETDKILGKKDTDKLFALLSDLQPLISIVNTQYNIGLEQTTVVNAEISRYYSRLAEIRAGLKINEWRDAEGKFNTARLASDSIAGVVLGTVGGIVTSKLVKKNQLKKGFEDLDCNIGGQKVADYGDTFRVGLQ